jgi:hypothetical protein
LLSFSSHLSFQKIIDISRRACGHRYRINKTYGSGCGTNCNPTQLQVYQPKIIQLYQTLRNKKENKTGKGGFLIAGSAREYNIIDYLVVCGIVYGERACYE